MQTKYSVSVIIATYNRCADLKESLDALSAQIVHGDVAYEVIVADNNSNDCTKDTIASLGCQFNGQLKYVFEPQQGKSFALNTAIQKAKGDIIAITDDDAIADRQWLQNIVDCFQESGCDGVGGRVLPRYDRLVPQWVRESQELLCGPIVNHDYGEQTKMYQAASMNPLICANAAFKRSLFAEYGYFRTDLGPGTGAMGDDTELFLRLKVAGRKLYYCGKALIWHKVDNARITFRYFAKWFISLGRFEVRVEGKRALEGKRLLFGVPCYLLRYIATDAIITALKVCNRKQLLKQWKKLFYKIGMALEFRRLQSQVSQAMPSTAS